MIIQAELRRKQSEYEGEACIVDKVIELPAQRFKQFSHALLADYDFIAENKNVIQYDAANFDDTASNAVSSMLSGPFQLGNFFIFTLMTNAVFMQLRRLELPEPGFELFYLSSAADF